MFTMSLNVLHKSRYIPNTKPSGRPRKSASRTTSDGSERCASLPSPSQKFVVSALHSSLPTTPSADVTTQFFEQNGKMSIDEQDEDEARSKNSDLSNLELRLPTFFTNMPVR